jgi:hypothetical protein
MRIVDDILEARKELSDKQKDLDKNKNGKIDSEDLKAVRAKRDDVYSSDYKLDKNGHKTKAHKITFKSGEHEVKEEHMSPEQTKKKEDIVKGMKKSYKGFVQRYGKDRAKSVMYATATKNAMKEEAEMNEALHPEADKVLKHIKPEHHAKYKPDLAKGIYKGDFADRTAVLKAAKNAGHLKEDLDEVDIPLNESYDPADYEASHEKSQFGGHRAKLTNKKTGKVSYLGATGYHKPEHAKGEAEAYRTSYNHSGKSHPGATYSHDKAISAYRKKAKEAGHIAEAMWPGTPEYKKKFDTDRVTGAGARHDIKKTATGVIATRRFADNDTAEKPKDAPKRGRGRPKKDKFAEAVEFLIGLDEETFDSLMEEGFDSFMEQYEQLDEISKATLGSYIKKATNGMSGVAINAHQAGGAEAGSKERKTFLAKANKRIGGIAKAADRLTK